MNANKLKAEIVLKGLKPSELLEKMQEKGIKMSKASYYRRIKDFDKFDRAEILAIAEIVFYAVSTLAIVKTLIKDDSK
ncbi:TPA: BetR domain protein [Staphylococcus pseudintermedius]